MLPETYPILDRASAALDVVCPEGWCLGAMAGMWGWVSHGDTFPSQCLPQWWFIKSPSLHNPSPWRLNGELRRQPCPVGWLSASHGAETRALQGGWAGAAGLQQVFPEHGDRASGRDNCWRSLARAACPGCPGARVPATVSQGAQEFGPEDTGVEGPPPNLGLWRLGEGTGSGRLLSGGSQALRPTPHRHVS